MKGLLLASLLLNAWPAIAAGPGTTSFDFLNIGVGARQIGMGGVGVSLGDDVNGAFYNPAALGRLGQQEASLMYTRWLQSMSYAYAGYVHPTVSWGNFGGQLHYMDLGSFNGFDVNGNPTGNFSAQDLLVGAGWVVRKLPKRGPKEQKVYPQPIGREELDFNEVRSQTRDHMMKSLGIPWV